jgi:DNA-binding SARP family transcriptional activator
VPPWLTRLLHALAAGDHADIAREVATARQAAAPAANPWIDAALDLLDGLTDLVVGGWDGRAEPAATLSRAHERFRALGASVPASWCAALAAAALAWTDWAAARREADAAARLARAAGCPGALILAVRVQMAAAGRAAEGQSTAAVGSSTVAEVTEDDVVDVAWLLPTAGPHGPGRAPALAAATEPPLPAVTEAPPPVPNGRSGPPPRPKVAPDVQLRCFAKFELVVDGQPVDTGLVKPRARALLHLLALHAGRAVHRDQILAALWPDEDERAGVRSLQVAVSALRQLLEREVGQHGAAVLARDGGGYVLGVGRGSADVVVFADAIERARTARAASRPLEAVAACTLALETYRGDLLPEEGAAEWVVESRERHRIAAADVALHLALYHLEADEPDAAIAVCERGLQIDRYRDGLWKTVIAAHERTGNRAAAARSIGSYRRVLEDLGVAD